MGMLGDFNIYELQGVDSQVVGSEVLSPKSMNGSLEATILQGNNRDRIDNGMRIFVMGAVFFGPLLFLNVFIGVLSSAYDSAKSRVNEIFAQFRLSTLLVLILRDYFWTCFWCCCSSSKLENPDRTQWRDFHGVWIKLPVSSLGTKVV